MNLRFQSNPLPILHQSRGSEIFYPESDDQPMAETDLHANILIYLKTALELFFADREDVYVTGNIMFYYEEGEPSEVVSPDVMVCFGVPKGERTSYKIWEESDVVPSVVLEISSRGTWSKDRVEKRLLYEMLGVKEYFIFNPLYPKNSSSLLAFRQTDGEYESLKIENERIKSEMLNLDLVVSGRKFAPFKSADERVFEDYRRTCRREY